MNEIEIGDWLRTNKPKIPAAPPVYHPAKHLLFLLELTPFVENARGFQDACSVSISTCLSVPKNKSLLERTKNAVTAIQSNLPSVLADKWYIQRLLPMLESELKLLERGQEREGTSTNTSAERILIQIEMTPVMESIRNQKLASQAAEKIKNAMCSDVSPLVKFALAIEAMESEDHYKWPRSWYLPMLHGTITSQIYKLIGEYSVCDVQKKRLKELKKNPELYDKVMQGLTKVLYLDDVDSFIKELIATGRRKVAKESEMGIKNDKNVLYVALSYKHAGKPREGGTIDEETAMEAFQIISNIPFVSTSQKVRLWIDQNLHRYDDDDHAPWYTRGFLPYSIFPVVSALGTQNGFSIAKTRPWIWFETGMAMCGDGIYCRPEIFSTITEIMEYPENCSFQLPDYNINKMIVGTGISLYDCLYQMMTTVSLWTPNILEHKEYEYAKEFSRFAMWAKAQLVHLKEMRKVSLCDIHFEGSILEHISWIKSLPSYQPMRTSLQLPYLILEYSYENSQELISLIRACGMTRSFNNGKDHELVDSIVSRFVFCWKSNERGTVQFNTNPVPRNWAQYKLVEGDLEYYQIKDHLCNWIGGFVPWDSRLSVETADYAICGYIFSRFYGMYNKLGELTSSLSIAGKKFNFTGFMESGCRYERVYKIENSTNDILISESDMLCATGMVISLQRKLVHDIQSSVAYPAMKRILNASKAKDNTAIEDNFELEFDSRALSWCKDGFMQKRDQLKFFNRVLEGKERIVTGVSQFGSTIVIKTESRKKGVTYFSFRSKIKDDAQLNCASEIKRGANIKDCFSKIRCLMGTEDLKCYSTEALKIIFDV